jgi:hypothetical protein
MAETADLPRARPLGRSLDPLPGESLAGFVLRLAHRLRVSPDHVLRRTGLADVRGNSQAVAKSALSTGLLEPRARRFADAARLSSAEATGLTLAPLAGHYPPVARSLAFQRSGQSVPRLSWLFPAASRYCPRCLAGDSSAIQNLHGGPWRACWRLPVVFACPDHDVFLEHLCPGCGHAVGAGNHAHLVARPTIAGLHPAQCRQRHPAATSRPRNPDALCGTRLDQAPPPQPSDRPGPELLTLQRKINTRLAPEQPGVLSGQYFTELLLVAALVAITWPRARPPACGTALDAATRFLAEREDPARRHHSVAPPADARAGAVLLLAADNLLDSIDLRSALIPLAPVENRTGSGVVPRRHHSWDDMLKKHRAECSERFQLATENLVFSFRRDRGMNRVPAGGLRYRPEHVPAFLPQPWAERHLGAFTGLSAKTLRRGAAAFLVRRALGGGLDAAARFLGINPHDRHVAFGSRITRWVRSQGDPHAFELALDGIAAELRAADRVDYQRRRQALARWTLPQDTWEKLLAQLDRQPGDAAITDDRKRLAVTVYIWTQVTQGESEFAPCPARIADDPVRRREWAVQRRNISRLFGQTDRHPHYRQLRSLLEPVIARLADTIDTGQKPRSGSW